MPPHARWEKLLVENTEMDIFVDEPTTPGPHPAIVVAHHRAGNDVATTKFVQVLAGCGYVAASPHLHHRRPKGEDTRDSIANLDDTQIVADLNATVKMLQMMNNVDPNRMAIAGHCMGGRVSFLGVAEIEAFKCNIAYYSGNMFTVMGAGGVTPFEKLAKLRGPVLGFFGADDQNPSSDDVAKIDQRLSELGIEHEFHSYEGAGHAFQNFTNPGHYRPAATADSMTKMFSWLEKHL